jgi:predicted choloylglycine hydrolase
MAARLPFEWNTHNGFQFWVVVRGLLDRCRDTAEALELLRSAEMGCYTNFLVCDRSGQAALVEVAGAERAIKQIDPDSTEPYLISTNHYTIGEMPRLHKNQFILDGSIPRYRSIEACIQSGAPGLTREDLRSLLSREVPAGCFGPYYTDGFGTLWSSIFDLSEGSLEVCFGAPGYNPWRTFSLNGDAAGAEYPARFPDKQSVN